MFLLGVGGLLISLMITAAIVDAINGYRLILFFFSDFDISDKYPKVSNFSKRSSFLVPLNYDYYEITNGKSIRTSYIQAASQVVASYIFEGMLGREGALLYRSVSEAPTEAWDVDQAYYLNENKTMILLLKDDVVILLDSRANARKICRDKLIYVDKLGL